MEGPQTVKHSSHSYQTLSVFRQRSFGDQSGIPYGRPRGDADALLKTLLVPSVSVSTIPTSASIYLDVNILTKIIFTFVGYSPVFGESPVLVNQFVYLRKRLMNKFLQVHLFSTAHAWWNLVISKRGSISDKTLNRRCR